MSEAIAGAIGLGLNKIGESIARRGENYGALNQIALSHAMNSASMQQAHANNLEALKVAQGHALETLKVQSAYTARENAIARSHVSSENALQRENALDVETLKGKNKVDEVNAKSTTHLNEAQFALKHSKPGTPIEAGHLKFVKNTVDANQYKPLSQKLSERGMGRGRK